MCGLGCTKFFNIVLSLTGLGISAFALFVEMKSEMDEEFAALCDIDENISCTVLFNSEYGRGLGQVYKHVGASHPANQPNNVYGAIFYAVFLLFSFFNYKFIAYMQIFLSLTAVIGSAYLGYVLYFLLQNICVISVATAITNILLLLFSVCKKRALKPKVVKEDKYGYYIPTTNYPNTQNNNFKKFI